MRTDVSVTRTDGSVMGGNRGFVTGSNLKVATGRNTSHSWDVRANGTLSQLPSQHRDVKQRSRTQALEIDINAVDAEDKKNRKWTRISAINFTIADVSKPLASAAKVVDAGNVVYLTSEPGKSFIMNVDTQEK